MKRSCSAGRLARAGRGLALGLAAALALGCAGMRPPTPPGPPAPSGFLDDYARLRPGTGDELRWVYRNPLAQWPRYEAVLIEPVTLWRSGEGSLAAVPEEDLQRLVNLFERALRRRLGEGFRVVDVAGPGVIRIRLGITDARADDPILDVVRARDDAAPSPEDDALHPQTRSFVARAVVEGELRDAQTGLLLAEGIDRRPEDVAPAETWSDIDHRLTRWVDRACHRLEARTASD